jgi:hypothetical protein
MREDKISNKDKYISIEKLTKSGLLKTDVKGMGGYQENCIEFSLKNLTNDSLFVLVEPGRRLTADDSVYQDIFIVKKNLIALGPLESKTMSGYGFCCQSHDHSPAKGSKFSLGYMTPKEWIKLATVIDENKFPAAAIQNAVWTVSNNHPLSSIYDEDIESISLLRKTVAEIKGIEIPWYSLTFVKDTARLFSGKPERVYGDLDYYINTNSNITINIRNKKGILVKTLVKDDSKGPGKYQYKLNLLVKSWPKGEYTVYVFQDFSNLNIKKTFVL